MKNLLIITTLALSIFACGEQELLAPMASSQEPTTKSNICEAAAQTTALGVVQDLAQAIATMGRDDILIVHQDMACLHLGIAVVYFDPGVIDAKEICQDAKSALAFAKCVYGYMKAGHKVTLWLDGDGKPHASI